MQKWSVIVAKKHHPEWASVTVYSECLNTFEEFAQRYQLCKVSKTFDREHSIVVFAYRTTITDEKHFKHFTYGRRTLA